MLGGLDAVAGALAVEAVAEGQHHALVKVEAFEALVDAFDAEVEALEADEAAAWA